jgi:large subunit ribosomal protein L15
MELNDIQDNDGARKSRMRVGRGIGSGKGKTAGRGHKGQKSRSGVAIKGFEGGQMPIHRRLPKRGFNNHTRLDFDALTLRDLQLYIDNGSLNAKETITTQHIRDAGIVPQHSDGVKLLVKGELKTKVTLDIDRASKNAIAAVEKLGGSVAVKEKAVYPKGKQPKWEKKA